MSATSNNILLTTLTEFGLSDKEASVYLALLELESASVQDIAKFAGVNRSSTYVVLESLRKKRLTNVTETKKGPRYMPASPEMLYKIAEDSSRKMNESKEKIRDIIPALKALYKDDSHRPSVRIFESKDDMKVFFEDTVVSSKKGSLMRAFSQRTVWENLGKEYFTNLQKSRIEKEINLKVIYPNEVKQKEDFASKNPKKRLAEIRFLPKNKHALSVDFRIYEDKVAITSWKDEFGIIIENKEIADAIKYIFDFSWEHSEQLGAKNKSSRKK